MSNLLKGSYTNVVENSKRVIDMNELIAMRLKIQAQKAQEGFRAGLNPEEVDPDEGNVLDYPGEEAYEQPYMEETNAILDDARAEAAGIVEEARVQAESIIAEASEQLNEIRNQAIAEGREQGYNEGMLRAESEMQALRKKLDNERLELEEAYQDKYNELEPMFVDMLTGIYEYLFHVDVHSFNEVLPYLISTTLRNVEGSREFLIHVSKDDYPNVNLSRSKLQASVASVNATLDILEDPAIPLGECMIETENGIYDCGLGSQLSELNRRLKLMAYSPKE